MGKANDGSFLLQLCDMARHEIYYVRIQAIRQLMGVCLCLSRLPFSLESVSKFSKQITSVLILRVMNDDHPVVRHEAVEALGNSRFDGDDTLAALEYVAIHDAEWSVRVAAIRSLCLKTVKNYDTFFRALEDRALEVRLSAVDVLRCRIHNKDVRDRLIKVAENSDKQTSLAAIEALAPMGIFDEEFMCRWVVESPFWRVRLRLVQLLGKHGAFNERVESAIRYARCDINQKVREASAKAFLEWSKGKFQS